MRYFIVDVCVGVFVCGCVHVVSDCVFCICVCLCAWFCLHGSVCDIYVLPLSVRDCV